MTFWASSYYFNYSFIDRLLDNLRFTFNAMNGKILHKY